MACACQDDDGRLSPNTLTCWLGDPRKVLANPKGLKLFKEFIVRDGFEDAVYAVQFWEKCKAVLSNKSEIKPKKKHKYFFRHNPSHEEASNLRNEAQEALSIANHPKVNLDGGDVHRLWTAIEHNNSEEIKSTIIELQQKIENELVPELNLFCSNVTEQKR